MRRVRESFQKITGKSIENFDAEVVVDAVMLSA
jgi:hypothetical protein